MQSWNRLGASQLFFFFLKVFFLWFNMAARPRDQWRHLYQAKFPMGRWSISSILHWSVKRFLLQRLSHRSNMAARACDTWWSFLWKSCSNLKSIGWKVRISEIWPMLTFWPMLTSKIICGWIEWADLKILFKFQVNRMKIDNFCNSGMCWPLVYVDLQKSERYIAWSYSMW